jgi:hypothetical protein
MLADNLDLAKESLVSKSDTENETYLFRAACSELRVTLQAGRHTEMQRERTQRAHLTHEADILSQKLTQDLLALKEDLKAMFHNRKIAVQEDMRNLDGRISELNYKITVLLNSDVKSDVEGLRWVLTRRAALAVGLAACKKMPPLFRSFVFCLLTELAHSYGPFQPELRRSRNTPKGRRRQEKRGGQESSGGEGWSTVYDRLEELRNPNR